MVLRSLAWLLLLGFCAPAQTPAQLEEELDAYRRTLMDWGGLTRYGSDNSEVKLDPNVSRVVFLGDEITENWPATFFSGKPYFNRGITRQTAAQMLVRFRQDVVGLKPKAVIIQAGTNDIASVMGPSTEPTTADHIMSMVELARAHSIKVILASVTPVCDCKGKTQTVRRKPFRIASFNNWLKQYAKDSGSLYLDWFTPLAQGRALNPDYTPDGFHLNEAAYQRLVAPTLQAIEQALR